MDSLQEYLHAEFNYVPYSTSVLTEEFLISEEHGYVPNFDKYVEAFRNALPEKWKTQNRIVLTDRNFESVEDKFFADIEIIVSVGLIPKGYSFEGGYVADDKDFIDSNKKLHSPRFHIDFYTNDRSSIEAYLQNMFAHELTHMYENYQRKLKRVKTLGQVASGGMYGVLADEPYSEEKIKRLLKQFLYWINPAEQNAHIGSIKSELMLKAQKRSDIYNSRKALDLIQDTETYREYKMIRSFILYLEREHISEQDKEIMLRYFKELQNKVSEPEEYSKQSQISTYPELYRYIIKLWDRYSHKFKRAIAKAAYDVFSTKTLRECQINQKLVDFLS